MKVDRLTGSEAISQKAVAIGAEHGVVITKCVWDIGEDVELSHAHRLDLFTETKTVRLYFPDPELTRSDNEASKKRIEGRLHSAIAQLSTKSPLPTYAYR